MDARPRFEGEPYGFNAPGISNGSSALSEPVSPDWDSQPHTDRWLADRQFADGDPKDDYLIQGWLARTGTSVWFGAGSTGKTQLMLWMVAMLASLPEDRPEQIWLGSRIHDTGHVLVLTAEDTREQIVGRLRDVVKHALRQDDAARLRTCGRIHIMPFLSMGETEFRHPNPSLFHQPPKEREWETSPVMLEVRRYIRDWNLAHDDPRERIIGVVMDSATSMSGFDSLDAQATTNFFFYLGRLCEAHGIFWAIIGHTPKTTTMTSKTYRATAPSRLRGVAMWTTAPRLTVEVRLSQSWREGRKYRQERQEYLDWLPGEWHPENLIVVYVAKANLKHAYRDERYLARQRHGAFVDVTNMPEDALADGSLDGWEPAGGPEPAPTGEKSTHSARGASPSRTSRGSFRRGRPPLDPSTYSPGTALVRELLISAIGVGRDGRVSANALMTMISTMSPADPRGSLVRSASGGGKLPARVGAINWHLDRLAEDGMLERRGRRFHLLSK